MAEMIVPGTYIDVRAEGLISAGRVATGIVGIVGTAARGEIGKPVTLASFANAREHFGLFQAALWNSADLFVGAVQLGAQSYARRFGGLAQISLHNIEERAFVGLGQIGAYNQAERGMYATRPQEGSGASSTGSSPRSGCT